MITIFSIFQKEELQFQSDRRVVPLTDTKNKTQGRSNKKNSCFNELQGGSGGSLPPNYFCYFLPNYKI